jgi:hypothetical protein
MKKHEERFRDFDDELPTQIPTAPNRDLGTGGTKEVDGPWNTDDLSGDDLFGHDRSTGPAVPEPPG